ncbi:MAG: hypothetical protein HKL90_11915 [Elusimicrobia bacterium]|nr:hypothetical protein [Elusimicrobiota bacterium]
MMNRNLSFVLAGSLAFGAISPSLAENGVSAGTAWQPTVGHSPEGTFTQADQIALNQVATQGRLDQLCRNVPLSANVGKSFPDAGLSLGILRRLVTLPSVEHPQDLELYQVDEYTPAVSLSPSLSFPWRTSAALGLGVGASFSLDSTVVRPRSYFKGCAEIKKLLDVADVKLVFPPSLLKHGPAPTPEEFVSVMAPRIAKMEDGELWSLSGVTTVSAALSGGAVVGHVSAGVSIGGMQDGAATMIVHRLSRTHIRFSLRVSHLHVFNAQGSIADVPIITLFRPGGALTVKNELEKVFDGVAAGRLVDYFTASFSALQQIGNQSTQQYLVVFDLDPTDPAQTDELARMMQSDFLELIKKAVGMQTMHASQKATLDNYAKLTQEHESVFDRVATLVQTDVGRIDDNHSVTLTLPVLGSHSRASSSSSDSVVTVDATGAGSTRTRALHLATADRPKTDIGLSIPIINRTLVSDNSDTKYTGFYFADDGKLQILYSHIDAFQRRATSSVQGTLNQFRDMLAMVGSRGNPAADADPKQYQIKLPHEGLWVKSGSLSFSLDINAAGVANAFNASAAEIQRAAERVYPISNVAGGKQQAQNNYDRGMVAEIVKTLVAGRDETPDQRNKALRDLMVRESNSNVVVDSLASLFSFLPLPSPSELSYEGVMKVLLQLADRQDVSANLVYSISGDGTAPQGAKDKPAAPPNVSVNQSDANPDLLDAGRANRVRTPQPQYMDVNQ